MVSVKHPTTNTDFGTAVLYALATDLRLSSLYSNLVLKGGAALLLGFGSGRATRKDLDFDVLKEVTVSETDVAALFAALRKWNAQYVPGGRVTSGSKAHNIGEITFQDPRTRDIGKIKIQISQRRLPPTLHERIKRIQLRDPLTANQFGFPMMCLEGIAAEKMIRSYKRKDENGRPSGGPSMNDMYDIGFIAAWRPTINVVEVKTAFNILRRLEQADDIVIESARLDALALRAYAATDLQGLMGDSRVVDSRVGFQRAKTWALDGIRSTKGIAGLAPTLPVEPTRKR